MKVLSKFERFIKVSINFPVSVPISVSLCSFKKLFIMSLLTPTPNIYFTPASSLRTLVFFFDGKQLIGVRRRKIARVNLPFRQVSTIGNFWKTSAVRKSSLPLIAELLAKKYEAMWADTSRDLCFWFDDAEKTSFHPSNFYIFACLSFWKPKVCRFNACTFLLTELVYSLLSRYLLACESCRRWMKIFATI